MCQSVRMSRGRWVGRRKEERERTEQECVLKRSVVIQMSLECGM
jgi:hypothetical protein